MTAIDDLAARNAGYAAGFSHGDAAAPPRRKVAVLTCMDARLDPAGMLGLAIGDAHVIRNAGGVATEDAIRSLVISQRLLGTEEIMVIHHTDCGMESFRDDDLRAAVEADTGIRPTFAFEAFADAEADVAQTARRLRQSPFLRTDELRGFVYDVRRGELREVAFG